MTTLSCALGVDLGTSAVKVVAVSRRGRIVASARESYPTITRESGQAEQRCDDWLKALSRAITQLNSPSSRELKVEAIGLTGQMPTLVVLHGGKPLGHAITWQDSRADAWTSKRLNPELRHDIYRRTGIVIDGRYLAPMFNVHRPKSTRANFILSAKDFLLYSLTGVSATDPSTASGYAVYNLTSGDWDVDLCRIWDITVEQLPSIKKSSCSLPLSRRGSKLIGCAPGTPVAVGGADSAAGVHALKGDAANDDVTILAGSSTVIIKPDANLHFDPEMRYLLTPLALDHTYGREADLLASGSAREWVQNLLGRNDSKTRRLLWQSAGEIAPGANGLVFSPYLAGGDQGVLWNPDLRGTLSGLTCAHRPAHIARALLEGMSFEIRRCVEVLGDPSVNSVRITGWMTENPADLQILADILGRPVHAYKLDSASAVGAALITGFVNRRAYFSELKALVTKPTTENSRVYDDLYSGYIAKFPTN